MRMLHEVLLLLVANVQRADTPHHGRLPCCHGVAARQLSSPSSAVKNARARGSHGYELRMVTLLIACYCAHLVACASLLHTRNIRRMCVPHPPHILRIVQPVLSTVDSRYLPVGECLNVRCWERGRRDGAAELDPQAQAQGTRNSNSHGVGGTACKVPMPCCTNTPS